MSESRKDHIEAALPGEQLALLDVARTLLALPEAKVWSTTYKYRRTTGREMGAYILGKLSGSTKVPAAPREGLFEKAAVQYVTRLITLRVVTLEDFPTGTWGGGVYLSHTKATDLDSGNESEIGVSLYAQGTVNNPRGGVTEMSAYIEEFPWKFNLLEPLGDVELTKARTELAGAAERYHI